MKNNHPLTGLEILKLFTHLETKPDGKLFSHTITFDRLTPEQLQQKAEKMGMDSNALVQLAQAVCDGTAECEISPDGQMFTAKF